MTDLPEIMAVHPRPTLMVVVRQNSALNYCVELGQVSGYQSASIMSQGYKSDQAHFRVMS
eukprot:5598002-Pleurochrysis_carterae.AAC.2